MKLYEVKDVVREHVGRDKLAEPVFDWCLRRGLREIEKRDNFYWMEASKLFEVYASQQEYSLRNDVAVDDYKDTDVLFVSDRDDTDPRWEEVTGPEPLTTTKGNFTEGDSGQPAFWSLREEGDDPTILLWPPLPDQAYRAELHYYRWTELPADANSTDHEVLRRWPEALIYLATAQGILVSTKDAEAAAFWELQFYNPVKPDISTEYKKMHLYQEQRKASKRYRNGVSSGTATLNNKLAQKQRAFF